MISFLFHSELIQTQQIKQKNKTKTEYKKLGDISNHRTDYLKKRCQMCEALRGVWRDTKRVWLLCSEKAGSEQLSNWELFIERDSEDIVGGHYPEVFLVVGEK